MKNSFYFRIIGIFVAIVVVAAFSAPHTTSAFWEGFPFGERPSRDEIAPPFQLCERTISIIGIVFTLQVPCAVDTPPPPPEEPNDPEVPEDPTLEFSADPDTIDEGDSSILAWEAENADTCTASDGWDGDKPTSGSEEVSPTETTTYTLTCEGEGGEVMESVVITVVPAPDPVPGPEGVVINEIAWMGTDIGGSATQNANAEWIELRNLGSSGVDLGGWTLIAEDDTPNISISSECVNTVIPASGFFLLVRTNDSILGIPADCTYTGALANSPGGELLVLRDAAADIVDFVDGKDGWNIGGGEQKGDNGTKDTAQRDDDSTWFTAPPTPGASNVLPNGE